MSIAKVTSTAALGTLNKEEKDAEIEQAIAQITTGDFQHKWDSARSFSKHLARWDNRPIPYLIDRLNRSTDPENQWFLIRTLSHYDHPVVVETLASYLVTTTVVDLQIETTKALTQLGRSAIATLTHLIQQPHTDKRILAARALAKIRRTDVIEPLLSVVTASEAELRLIAVEALGSFHDPRITNVLLNALKDEAPIAIEAIRALGRRSDLLSTIDLIEPLQQLLLGEETVAKESAIALGRLGTESCTTALGQVLTQPAPTRVKVAAVRALSWLNTPASTLYLSATFESPVPLVMPAVKQEIARALGQTRSADLKPIAARPLVAWIKAINAASNWSHAQSLSRSPSQSLSQSPSYSADTLQIENTFSLKQSVISALSRLGSDEAATSLRPLLKDPDARIQMHVISALEQISPELHQ